MLRRARQLVGVDIGSSAIKAVELKEFSGAWTVVALGSEPTPAGAVVDGTIVNPVAVSAALRCLFGRQRSGRRDVAVALSGGGVFVKRINAGVSDVELAASIEWEVEQHIPLELDEVNFDYQPLQEEAAGDATEILLVAARKEKVAQHAEAIRSAGGRAVVMDVAALALQNAYEANYDSDPRHIIALVDAGASTVTLHVVGGRRLLFTRDFASAGDGMLDAAAALDALDPGLAASIERILLTGGASKVPGFAAAFEARFDVPVEPLNPFRRIVFDQALFDANAAEAALTAAVAVGLALRRSNGR